MRKCAIVAVVLLCAGFVAVPAAMAGSVNLALSSSSTNTTFTIAGIYAPGTPTVPSFSAPGQAYSFSFTVLTNASANSGFLADTVDGIFFVDADMSLAFGGSTFDLGTLQIEFDNVLNGNVGGLFFCVDTPGSCSTGTVWAIAGEQLFTGTVASPTFGIPGLLPGTNKNAQIDLSPALSGYSVNGAGPFPFSAPAPTPEPASMLLLGTGLLGIGVFARKRLRSAWDR